MDSFAEFLGSILGIALVIWGLVSLFKFGREKGIGAVLLAMVGMVILAAFL